MKAKEIEFMQTLHQSQGEAKDQLNYMQQHSNQLTKKADQLESRNQFLEQELRAAHDQLSSKSQALETNLSKEREAAETTKKVLKEKYR